MFLTAIYSHLRRFSEGPHPFNYFRMSNNKSFDETAEMRFLVHSFPKHSINDVVLLIKTALYKLDLQYFTCNKKIILTLVYHVSLLV